MHACRSTLEDPTLAALLRKGGGAPAIVAVDPSSPFTGGALLGDRVRMLTLDPEVFIRSMSSRGRLGGIAEATDDAVDVLDAAGYDVVLVETVGVGQSEVEVAATADTTAVVMTPEGGDGVQTLKAGLLEVADVIAVNKADREGAAALEAEVRASLALRAAAEGGWEVPVLLTAATAGRGVAELWDALAGHRKYMLDKGLLRSRRRKNLEIKIRRIVESALARLISPGGSGPGDPLGELLDRVDRREVAPHAAAAELLQRMVTPRFASRLD